MTVSAIQIERIRQLSAEGKTVDEIKEITGLGNHTIRGHRNAYLDRYPIYCECGRDIRHGGWCKFRMDAPQYHTPEKVAVREKNAKKKRTGICSKCGGVCFEYSHRCSQCYLMDAQERLIGDAAKERICAICSEPREKNARTCGNKWCVRIHTFYYVEGRTLPSTAWGGKNNKLRFDLLLSDYIRRLANEKLGKEYRRAA